VSERDIASTSKLSAQAAQPAQPAPIDLSFSTGFAAAAIRAEIQQNGHLSLVSSEHDPFHLTRMELSQSPRNVQPARQDHLAASPAMNAEKAKITPMQERLARASERVAEDMHSTFKCSAGVQTALAAVGLDFWSCGDAWQMGKVLQGSGRFEIIPESEVRRGDIGVQAWSSATERAYYSEYHGRNLGDIFVVQKVSHGQIIQTNDHEQEFHPSSETYDPSKRYFLRIES
jgi:hypothetical protein